MDSEDKLREFLPAEEDLAYEEELLRNPYNVKMWLRYIDARKGAPMKKRHVLYERALQALPGSYKVCATIDMLYCNFIIDICIHLVDLPSLVEQFRIPRKCGQFLLRWHRLTSRVNRLSIFPMYDAVMVCIFEGAAYACKNGFSGFASSDRSE